MIIDGVVLDIIYPQDNVTWHVGENVNVVSYFIILKSLILMCLLDIQRS